MQLKKETIIISGFPGVGKTSLYNMKSDDLIILDSDSSAFDKADFPENYIKHIKENMGKVDIILVSSHKDVRLALDSNKIKYILIYPNLSLKDEYLERYRIRGSVQPFIDLISKNWELWIKEIIEHEHSEYLTKIELESGEFVTDFLRKFKKYKAL